MDIYDFLIADEIITAAVSSACEFFDLPEVPVVNADGVCVWSNDVHTTLDDVLGLNREQLVDLGVTSPDAITLAYTHECAHRALQGYNGIGGKIEELACDFFAGIHSQLNDVDSEQFKTALGSMAETETHPEGTLRTEALEFGKQVAADMTAQGIEPSFANCMDRFEDFILEHNISETALASDTHNYAAALSFGAAYTPSEYVEKANNCYKEADYYQDKGNREDDPSRKAHYYAEAEKWRRRGDEYMNKAKYAK